MGLHETKAEPAINSDSLIHDEIILFNFITLNFKTDITQIYHKNKTPYLPSSAMLSKNRARFFISLQRKKERDINRLFVIEGDKVVREYLLTGKRVVSLVAKPEWLSQLPLSLTAKCDEIIQVSYEELKSISTLKSPHNALAIVPYAPDRSAPLPDENQLFAVLENIQDPGNMGTIVRAAAWFGIEEIICSENCVDIYNPKVIQATMGAFNRVEVSYCGLAGYLEKAGSEGITVYSTSLEGESIYDHPLSDRGLILFGNESKGVSAEIERYADTRLFIPGRGIENGLGIESLNVSMAASIVFSDFARRRVI